MASISRGRRVRTEDGAEIVEFAITLPLLLLIVMGIIEFGFLFREYEIVTNAAREGARIGVLPNYDDADIQTRVADYLSSAGLDSASWVITPGTATMVNIGGTTCVSLKPVDVFYHHQVVFLSGIASYFGASFSSITLHGESAMRTEVAAGTCP